MGGEIVRMRNYNLTMRSLKDVPSVQIIYLRLPDGAPDGQGFKTNHKQSLKKHYEKKIRAITSTDGESTYSLDSLKDLIANVLDQSTPHDIRVLDYRASIAKDGQNNCEHTDHTVSARLVADVIRNKRIKGRLMGYAGTAVLNLMPNLNEKQSDFFIKADAFFEFAKHDKHICQTREDCYNQASNSSSTDLSQDVKYVVNWLEREYYVS